MTQYSPAAAKLQLYEFTLLVDQSAMALPFGRVHDIPNAGCYCQLTWEDRDIDMTSLSDLSSNDVWPLTLAAASLSS
jgi:hypothetical protein